MVLLDVTLRDMKKPVNETGQVGLALLKWRMAEVSLKTALENVTGEELGSIKCNLKVTNGQSI